MITPKYTGFYKPGLTVKAAKLSLQRENAGEANSPVRLAGERGYRMNVTAEDRGPARAA
jgi:hypothetical protein